jgi:metabolite-proton symporter
MQIDSTPLDVRAVLDNGLVDRAELTGLVDQATRTLAAVVLRPTTKSVDAALLLARALTPEPMRPGWVDALRMSRSVLPHHSLTEVDQRLADAAARPVIAPETIVFDHGKVFLSQNFRSACRALGISLQPAHPDTPTDKPVIERTLQTVATLFCQYVAGYVGSSVERRGKKADEQAVWSMVELQAMLDEWCVAVWQNRPHDGLPDPVTPGKALTPNEKYAAPVRVAGHVAVPLSADDYVELLPATWRTINSYGVKIAGRTYDAKALNPVPLPAFRCRPPQRSVGGPPRPLRRVPCLGPQPPRRWLDHCLGTPAQRPPRRRLLHRRQLLHRRSSRTARRPVPDTLDSMIIWLNGTFRAGKTGTAQESTVLLPESRIFDACRHLPRLDRTGGTAVTTEAATSVTPMKRVAAACLVGSAIEFYDFFIYGTAAALVFPTVFFPHLSPAMATIASMGTFATAFLSRPLGALVFGHFGDRLGRKKTLVATLLIMALSTVAVGLIPNAAAIGVAAPSILTGLRLLQGFALGGEWAGSALLSAEYAPAAKRGRYGMFTPLGAGAGLVLASLTFLGVNYTIGEHSSAFMQWGWRIPFLISAALIGIGLYVRLNINETPVFAKEKVGNLIPKAPLGELLRLQRREVALAAGSVLCCFSFNFMASSYLPTYGHTHLGYSRNVILFVGVLGGLAYIALVAFSATLCDRIGRRRMILVGWVASLLWSIVVIPLMDTGKPIGYAVAIVGMHAAAGIGFGPIAAFLPELFPTRYRYSGTALALNIAGVAGGAVPPLIAGALQDSYGSWAIGLMLAIVAAVSLVCTYLLPETKGTALRSIRAVDDASLAS